MRNLVWVAVALGSIWMAVLIISFASPDLVYGVDQNTFPLIPSVTWISGAVASAYALKALVEPHESAEDQRNAWIGIATSTAIIWAAVTIVCLVMPTYTVEIGDNPIELPLAQLLAPAAGAVGSAIAGQYVPLLTDVAAIAADKR